ncbi:response regulator [Sphingomonas echinoides]|uniref:response regulator n=1 Tax=Sphingomonas echinoides TaxID=59803 RepID=UPI0024135293|nr:response regulator [Sphingomonas echinoides]
MSTDQASGVPADGAFDQPSDDLIGRPGERHWKQSTITDPSLEKRGGIFFAAIEMTRMPMVLTNPRMTDNPIVFANNAFLDLTGYDQDEVVGRNCRFLQGPLTDRAVVAQLRTAIAERRAISLEILNYRRDGSPFWNGVFLGPVYDEAGELLYFFASQLDVSRRKEAETNAMQSQKMESIGQLTAGLAHDFNNLLQVVNGSLELMAAKREDQRAFKRYHEAALTAAQRGTKLTAQLLSFARRSRLEPRQVEISSLVSEIAELLESTVGSRVDLQLNLRRRLPAIQVDPVHFETALINVVSNARDAIEAGGTITIATSLRQIATDEILGLAAGSYVLLEIVDSGHGMTQAVLDRAIEPFFTTKPKGAGTGLGLAMAQGFAQQSDGVLKLSSTEGEGTTVRFYFPIAEHDRPVQALEPDTTGFRAEEVDKVDPPLILVVEDEAAIAFLAEEILSDAGYAVKVANDADEGLRLFEQLDRENGVALVFSDVVMPGPRNGLALAHEIRGRNPKVPILMTTGYNDEMSINGPQPEALDVLGKPYRKEELVERVQAALRRRAGPAHQRSDFGHALG